MNKTHLVWYAICLTLLLSCGSVRHNQMVASERDRYEDLWRQCQYKWLMCATRETNFIVRAGVKADSLQQEIWNRDGMIDSLKLELRNANYEFTYRKERDW